MRKALLVVGVGIGVLALIVGAYMAYMFVTNRVEAAPEAAAGKPVVLSGSDSVNSSSQSVPINTAPSSQTNNNVAINSQNTTENRQQSSQSSGNNSNNSSGSTSGNSAPAIAELKSYLQYQDGKNAMFGELVVGSGPEVKAGSKVTINYRGWLTDGKPFDDSYQRGKPLAFVVGQHQVVVGMEEGVFGMKVGGKRRIIIPPSVGYGTTANGPVPANSIMVFDVELVGSE